MKKQVTSFEGFKYLVRGLGGFMKVSLPEGHHLLLGGGRRLAGNRMI